MSPTNTHRCRFLLLASLVGQAVDKVLRDPAFQKGRYVANLGEGLGGKESTDLVQYFLDVVKGEA